jgi:hypothetical protein
MSFPCQRPVQARSRGRHAEIKSHAHTRIDRLDRPIVSLRVLQDVPATVGLPGSDCVNHSHSESRGRAAWHGHSARRPHCPIGPEFDFSACLSEFRRKSSLPPPLSPPLARFPHDRKGAVREEIESLHFAAKSDASSKSRAMKDAFDGQQREIKGHLITRRVFRTARLHVDRPRHAHSGYYFAEDLEAGNRHI